jgi:hypothetical protein
MPYSRWDCEEMGGKPSSGLERNVSIILVMSIPKGVYSEILTPVPSYSLFLTIEVRSQKSKSLEIRDKC